MIAPPLARLEIDDAAVAAALASAPSISTTTSSAVAPSSASSAGRLAAAASIVLVVLFGIPLIAERLAPLVPGAFEKRLGDAADRQVKALIGGKTCEPPARRRRRFRQDGDQALSAAAGGLTMPLEPAVLPTRRFRMRSRCPAARSILFDGFAAKGRKTPTRLPA